MEDELGYIGSEEMRFLMDARSHVARARMLGLTDGQTIL